MDGLEALVKPIGPSMEGFNAGQETARKYEEQQNQQGLRQAQMQEILQNIEQRKQTNPLDLQSKQVKLQSDKLDAAIKQNETYLDFLGKAGTVLESVPALPGQRHAVLNQMLAGSGIDAKNPEVQQVMKQLEQVPADQLPKTLGTLRDRLVQTSSAYQQKKMEMDAHIKQSEIAANATLKAAQTRADVSTNKGQMSMATLTKLSPDKRYGVLAAALASNKNPVTDADMSPEERSQWQSMADSDLAVLNANYSSRQQQGVTVQIDPVTKKPILANKTPPTLGNAPAAVPAQRKPLSAY